MSTSFRQAISFSFQGLDPALFVVARVTGEEAISRLFRFEVVLLSDDPDIDFDSVVGRQATLTLERNGEQRAIHGLVPEFALLGQATDGRAIYRAVLAPRLHLLSLSRQTQVHGTPNEMTVPEILRFEIAATDRKGPSASQAPRLSNSDLELRLTESYPPRDYIVQYGESDLDFVQRLAEHAGICFFFDHAGGRDRVVFSDANSGFAPLPGGEQLLYRPTSGLANVEASAVRRFAAVGRQLPNRLYLRDYNYRLPLVPLLGDAEVDESGYGVVVEYGDHFRTPEEGDRLARIRAEEIRTQRLTFEGESDCVRLCPGFTVRLGEHFRSAFDQQYVVLSIRHDATQAQPGYAGLPGEGPRDSSYRAEFTCIPYSVPFRPARATAKPRVAGLTNAHIDAAGTGTRAEIDGEGRYKIRVPFDLRGEADGDASRWCRMASPYGGARSGMHFPLLKGTEVVLGCVNGDPDRPIIMGAVPNARNKSVVTDSSNTVNRIQTTSGMVFEMDDGMPLGGGGGGGTPAGVLQAQPAASGPIALAERPPAAGGRLAEQAAAAELNTSSDVYARISTPSTGASSDTQQAELRLGAVPSGGNTLAQPAFGTSSAGFHLHAKGDENSWIEGASYRKTTGVLKTASSNHYESAEGNIGLNAKRIEVRTTTSAPAVDGSIRSTVSNAADGDFKIDAGHDYVINVGGKMSTTITGNTWTDEYSNKVTTTSGKTHSFFMGHNTSMTLGSKLTVDLALNTSVTGGVSVSAFLGFSFSARLAGDFSLVMGFRYSYTMGLSFSHTTGLTVSIRDGAQLTKTTGILLNQNDVKIDRSTATLISNGINLGSDEFKIMKRIVQWELDDLKGSTTSSFNLQL